MSLYKVLVVGDSRVRFLQEQLNNTTLNLEFVVFVLPGANFQRIVLKTMVEISMDTDYQLIILIGGINNLTRLHFNPARHIRPRYRNMNSMVYNVTNYMRNGVAQIRQITTTPVVIGSLVGVRLLSYSACRRRELLYQQPLIDGAIVRINCLIRGINRLNDIQTLDLLSHVHRCMGHGGRYSTRYIHLHDGLHPGQRLLEIWASKIIGYCCRFFLGISHIQDWVGM